LGHYFLFVEIPSSLTDTPQSVGLLCTSDGQFAETSLPHNTQHSREIFITPGGIRTPVPSKRAAADVLLRRRSQWDQNIAVTNSDEIKFVPQHVTQTGMQTTASVEQETQRAPQPVWTSEKE
jgi:hypothetical protein